jgi:dTDP-4-amino-4,6-dideoxygalactose transaminase
MGRIYLSPPHMSGDEQGFMKEAFDTNWIAPLGPQVDAFEEEFAGAVQVPHAAALSSGTAALHLALRLLNVRAGDVVVCPTLTFSATANAVTYVGATPVFVDADPATWNLDPEVLQEALTALAREGKPAAAVIAVDLYGQCADYEAIESVCGEFGVPLIEDAAEALGAEYNGTPAGGFGRCAIFSFNGNKIITTSGGGMLVSDDEELVHRARYLATQARDPAPHYQHSEIGYNYRMSSVLAAIGRGQLRVLGQRVQARRRNFDHYQRELGSLPGVEFMPEAPYGRCTRWLTCLTIDPDAFGATREDVRLTLEAEDIEARPVWKPMHLQPVFDGCRVIGGPVSERLFELGLCLPSGSSLTEADRWRVINLVGTCCRST